jgi:hypothetical protein
MKRDSRRIFSTAENVSRFSPHYLIRFALKHPDDFKPLIDAGHIPPETEADKLDVASLVPLLTSTGVSQPLGDALFLINALATPRNRRLLAEEVQHTRPRKGLDFPAALSDADYAMAVWLTRPSILEAALSRVTLKSRRSFHYFTPGNPEEAARAPAMTEERLARLTEQLKGALAVSGRPRGVAVIPFLEDSNEDWLLVRPARFFDNEAKGHGITLQSAS